MSLLYRKVDKNYYLLTVRILKNIKNRSHDIIHTFKNYFTIILSVFSFSNNKFNTNKPKRILYKVKSQKGMK